MLIILRCHLRVSAITLDELLLQALKSTDPSALPPPSWSSVQSLHHSRAERGDTSPKG